MLYISYPAVCEFSYIGETKRPLETRLREHKAAIKRGEVQMSTVAEHVWTNQHQPLWGNARVLDIAANKTILLIKEAMHIHMAKCSSLMNRDRGKTHRGLLEADFKSHMPYHTHLFMTSCILFM